MHLMAQSEDAWVYFKDKPSEISYISNPLQMLSQRALDRRGRAAISFDSFDVPIEPSYVQLVKEQQGIIVKARSKWLNALFVIHAEDGIRDLLNLSCVKKIEFANKTQNSVNEKNAYQQLKEQ